MASNFARGHEMKDKQNGAWKKDVNVLYHELAVNSDHILNVLETVEFVFCLQITHLMYNDSEFASLHSASAVKKIFRSLFVQLVGHL